MVSMPFANTPVDVICQNGERRSTSNYAPYGFAIANQEHRHLGHPRILARAQLRAPSHSIRTMPLGAFETTRPLGLPLQTMHLDSSAPESSRDNIRPTISPEQGCDHAN